MNYFSQMARVAWLFLFSKFIELMDTVRFEYATHKLQMLNKFETDGFGNVVLNVGVVCSGVFCVAEETQSDHLPAHLPSFLHAVDVVVGCELCSRLVGPRRARSAVHTRLLCFSDTAHLLV